MYAPKVNATILAKKVSFLLERLAQGQGLVEARIALSLPACHFTAIYRYGMKLSF